MLTGFKLILLLVVLRLKYGATERPLSHPLNRMRTPQYRAKKKVVRGLWIAAGALMLAYPLAHFIVTLGLFTAFLSFSILDEAP